MPGFVVTNQMAGSLQAVSTSYKTQARIVGAASNPRVQKIVEMEYSAVSVPNATDCQIQVDLTYCSATAAGTSTAATPMAQDNTLAVGTNTAISTAGVNYSVEPTTVTTGQNWFMRGFNQRSGVLWQAAPGYEITLPAIASQGALQRALSTNYTGNVGTKIIWLEM